jgi:hypothetical protein
MLCVQFLKVQSQEVECFILLFLCNWVFDLRVGHHFFILRFCVFVVVELWFGNWKHSPSLIERSRVQQLESAFCNLGYMVGGFEFG